MGSKPEQADPLKSPQFAGMRPVGGLWGGLRGSARLRLEVAVNDAGRMRRGEATTGLNVHLEDRLAARGGRGIVASLPDIEGLPDDVFHGDELLRAEFADVVDLNHVGMRELGQRLGLALHPGPAQRVIRATGSQQLERDAAIELTIVTRKDLTHRAFAELGEDDVTTEALTVRRE